MARAMVQLDEEVKAKLENLPYDQFRDCKTASDKVAKLMTFQENTLKKDVQRAKDIQARNEADEKTMLNIGSDLKTAVNDINKRYGFRNEAAAIKILLEHWKSSDTFKLGVLELISELR